MINEPVVQVIPFIGQPNAVYIVNCSWCGTAGVGSYGDRAPRLYDHAEARYVAAIHDVAHKVGVTRNNTEG